MKPKVINLLLLCLLSYCAQAQIYSYANDDLKIKIELKTSADSILASVTLTTKSDSIFIISSPSSSYVGTDGDYLNVFVGWDQWSTFNYPMDLITIGLNQEYKFDLKSKAKKSDLIKNITTRINYGLYRDVKGKLVYGPGTKVYKDDLMLKMKWCDFTFPFSCIFKTE